MAPPQRRQKTSNCSLLPIYRPQKDERLSWPGWLTCGGWFTHISGHPSATLQVERRTRKVRRPKTDVLRSTLVSRDQQRYCGVEALRSHLLTLGTRYTSLHTVRVKAAHVDTGVKNDTRVHGPCWSSVHSWVPVTTPRGHGCQFLTPVFTGGHSVYRALAVLSLEQRPAKQAAFFFFSHSRNTRAVRSTRLSNRLSNWLYNRFDNRLYRVNGV